jgi:hypothetical protein
MSDEHERLANDPVLKVAGEAYSLLVTRLRDLAKTEDAILKIVIWHVGQLEERGIEDGLDHITTRLARMYEEYDLPTRLRREP